MNREFFHKPFECASGDVRFSLAPENGRCERRCSGPNSPFPERISR